MGERLRRYAFRGVLLVIWTGAAYYLFLGGMYSLFDLRELSQERQEALGRVDSLVARIDSLAQRGDSLASDPLAIERTAREEYGLVRDGELLIRFAEGTEADSAAAK